MYYQDERLPRSKWTLIRWFGFDQFVPERAVTSYWIPSTVFMVIRAIMTIYSTIIIWASLGSYASEGLMNRFFAYFTYLTYIGLHAYLVTSLYHHVRYILNKGKRPSSFLDQPVFLNYLYYYLYHSVICFNIVTPIVFWAFLARDTDISAESGPPLLQMWLTVSLHAASFFMMIIDVIFNRIKMQLNMILLVIINAVAYMCLAFLVHAIMGWWVYPFLDWSLGSEAALLYVLVGVIVEMSFFIQLAFHDLRDWIARLAGKESRPEESTLPTVSMSAVSLPRPESR